MSVRPRLFVARLLLLAVVGSTAAGIGALMGNTEARNHACCAGRAQDETRPQEPCEGLAALPCCSPIGIAPATSAQQAPPSVPVGLAAIDLPARPDGIEGRRVEPELIASPRRLTVVLRL